MPRAAVIVPFPFDEEGLDYRRAEMAQVELSGNVAFDYKPLKAGPKHFIGRHDEMLVEFAIFEAESRWPSRATTPSRSTR